jgi:hypothetical protein
MICNAKAVDCFALADEVCIDSLIFGPEAPLLCILLAYALCDRAAGILCDSVCAGATCSNPANQPCGPFPCGTCQTCSDLEICVPKTCPSGAPCNPNTGSCTCNNLCGDTCCSAGQTCSNGSCVTGCPAGDTPCGSLCCPPGYSCCGSGANAACGPFLNAVCCTSREGHTFVCAPDEVCCGDKCAGVCCATNVNGADYGCSAGQSCCGSPPSTICCGAGCCGGTSTAPSCTC